ncbi:MAG: hypothetical protein RAO92_05530 [Candidatus Euphemobacter frigidus]|nr:hypothetical protein [Candidatus Euphemobacter frigidus]MDP8275846.1 hypothetical protein [Candidatus Euphemobacter frigidus]
MNKIAKLVVTEDLNFAKDACYNFYLPRKYLDRVGEGLALRRADPVGLDPGDIRGLWCGPEQPGCAKSLFRSLDSAPIYQGQSGFRKNIKYIRD